MNARERFNATLDFEPVDRLPFMEFMGYWPETLERWSAEGLSASDPAQHFGYDPYVVLPIDFNFVPPFAEAVLEDHGDRELVQDCTGVVKVRYKHGSAMPHYVRFPIECRQDFLDLMPRLQGDDPARYPADWDRQAAALRNRDYPVGLVCRGFLAFERDFMDFATMMEAFAEQPEWIEEMMEFHLDFMIKLWDRVTRDVEIDLVVLGEDMAYKNGPMISPAMVRRMMTPRYARLTEFLRSRGVRHIIVDSDGDMRSLIPAYLDGGITGILPMERIAGVDPVELRREYPRLQMIGGIDKLQIALGGAHIEAEVDRVVNALRPTGGYIPSFDHSVHPGVSLADYERYLVRLRQAVACG